MSGVLRRTAHYVYDERNRCYRFSDWNTVVTGLGVMLEPSSLVPLPENGKSLDWNDSGTKISDLKNITSIQGLLGGTDWVTGYNLAPRIGD